MLASTLHGQSARKNQYVPYSYVFPIRAKLRWPLSLGRKRSGLHGMCLCSLLAMFTLACWLPARASCLYRVWYPVTRLGPPGFSPEPSRSWSTCEDRCIHDVSVPILWRGIAKRKSRTLQWMRQCLCLAACLRKVYNTSPRLGGIRGEPCNKIIKQRVPTGEKQY